MSVALVTAPDATVPLDLTIQQEGAGGVTGQDAFVRVRDGSTTDSFLDWADNTFKVVGWTEQFRLLDEVGRGHYTTELDLAVIGAVVGNAFVAEYTVDDGGDVVGDAHDIILVGQQALADMTQMVADVSLLRKLQTNRQEQFPGNPGTLILWDDDGVTPLKQWELRDAAGDGIIANVGCPAKRSAAAP
jgi:hypothetical protein